MGVVGCRFSFSVCARGKSRAIQFQFAFVDIYAATAQSRVVADVGSFGVIAGAGIDVGYAIVGRHVDINATPIAFGCCVVNHMTATNRYRATQHAKAAAVAV